MNRTLAHLVDPATGAELRRTEVGLSAPGRLFPIVHGIPRFVSSENYAESFGLQWKQFATTQLDSHTGIALSETRLNRCLQGRLAEVAGKRILEVGSGAGRFTELLLGHGAWVDSMDYSAAVEANAANNGASDRLTLVQADVRNMPFRKGSYDMVVCLGVIQHTPDPEQTIAALWDMVRPGGALVIDHYRRKLRHYLPPPIGTASTVYRWYFLTVPTHQQFDAVKRVFDWWFPWTWRFRNSRTAQFLLSRLSPIVCYYPHFSLRDRQMYYEWMLLDTHDAMTDVFKHRRTPGSIRRTLEALGAQSITVSTGGNGVEAYCEKPLTVAAD